MNPLDQLREMHLPPEPGLWPPAPGWWLFLVLAGTGFILLFWWWSRQWRANRYRREALAALDVMAREEPDLARLLELVRRTDLSAPGESTWASLPSRELLRRLDHVNNGFIERNLKTIKSRDNDVYSILSDTIYNPRRPVTSGEWEVIVKAARHWIRKHGGRQRSC